MKWTPGLVVLTILACGGDEIPSAPRVPDVAGVWTANWSNLNTNGLSCLASGVHLTLTQYGTRFSGTYNSGTLACNDSVMGTPNGMVVNGLLNGNGVTFQLDTPNLQQGGELSGSSMNGTAVWLVAGTNGQPVTLVGTWMATR